MKNKYKIITALALIIVVAAICVPYATTNIFNPPPKTTKYPEYRNPNAIVVSDYMQYSTFK